MPGEVLTRLASAAAVNGVEPILLTDKARVEAVLERILAANGRQIDDPGFVAELKSWLRFNAAGLARQRDGLFSASTGSPQLPDWLGRPLFDLFFTKSTENDKLSRQVRSSAGLILLVAPTNDRRGWASAGQAYQRFALQATVDGITHAFVNQPVEVPEIRRALQSLLGLGERRADLLLRFGYGPALPRSLRRPPAEVIAPQSA